MHKVKSYLITVRGYRTLECIGCSYDRISTHVERKDHFPIFLHVHHRPSIHSSCVQGNVETTEMRLPVVAVLALCVRVMNDHTPRRTPPLMVVRCSIWRSP